MSKRVWSIEVIISSEKKHLKPKTLVQVYHCFVGVSPRTPDS